jgi:hypothetical protein
MKLEILNRCLCLCAKRNSGKSVLLKYIVQANKHLFDSIFVICPSESINKFYSDIVPKTHIFEEYSCEWVEALMKKMTEINSKKPKDQATKVLLILDDICSDANLHSGKDASSLKKIFTRGRHMNITLLMTQQYIYHIPPICRSNCDYFLCGQMNKSALDLLCGEFLMGNLSKKEFIDMYYESTNDYGFLMINNNSIKDNGDLDEIYGIIKTPEKFV